MITHVKKIRGSALIAIIAAILIFSVLAASLIPMIGSSSRQAAISSLGDRAYFLAESGYRFLDGHYRNPGLNEIDRNIALEALDDETFTLRNEELDEDGQFHLRVYSYFYPVTINALAGQTQIMTNPPGRLPLNMDEDEDALQIQSGAMLSIDGTILSITGLGSPLTQEGDVVFTVNPLQEEISVGQMAYPVALSEAVTLTADGNLPYQAGHGGMFPLRNGKVLVDYSIKLNYRYNNREENRFEGVTFSDEYGSNPVIGANSHIILTNYSRVHATGITGGAEREVIYYNALSSSREPSLKIENITSDDLTPAEPDSVTIAEGDPESTGNQAIQITSADGAALLSLDRPSTQRAFDYYRSRAGGFLSYDAQVKVGFYGSSIPSPPYLDNPIPVNVAAGLTFRLNNQTSNINYNGYGLSFVRGGVDLVGGVLPVELYNSPLIVLWYQTDNGATREWLAYKKIIWKFYPLEPNVFDDVLNDWTVNSSSWSISSTFGRYSSPAWRYYGDSGGSLFSPLIPANCPDGEPDCVDAPKILLRFWSQRPADNERRFVKIISNIESITLPPPTQTAEDNGWYSFISNLTPHISDAETFRVQFERVASYYPHEWKIDDVEILFQWPAHNSTLAVRLQEATMVKFTSGGTESFEVGDRVYGQTSGVIGTIIADPLVNDPSWSTGTATGAVLLNDLSSSTPFVTGERIISIGHSNRGANVHAYMPETDAKTNIIKAYYASESGNPPGNSDPLDAQNLAYPRRTAGDNLRWPVSEGSEWTAERDYFRLIQWDMVNDAGVSNLESIPDFFGGTVAVDNTVLRHTHPDLQSQPLTAGAVGEVGLHAYGTGTTNIYFDDFGLKLVAPPSRGGFTAPFQQ